MGEKTKIEWCDSTVNLMVGCGGCELSASGHCYAEQLVSRYAGRKGWPEDFNKPAFFWERLDKALAWPDLTGTPRPGKPWLDGRPRMIFVNDLGDTFVRQTAQEWADLVVAVRKMEDSPHTWLFLTKRPHNLKTFLRLWTSRTGRPWPENCWCGTSVTDQATADSRIPELLKCQAAMRFLSIEPLLRPMDIRVPFDRFCHVSGTCTTGLPRLRDGLHWVIVGGESGPGARPMHPDWPRSLRDQCQAAGVPFFMKQMAKREPIPTDLQIREYPHA